MVSMGCLLFISVQMFMQAVKVLPYIFCRRGFLPLQRKSSSIPTALCGVCNRVVRESACMACKRSAVRSRYSPPKSTVLRWKYSAFLFAEVGFWGLHCFSCTVFRLLQAVPIQPPTFDFTPFSKRNVCRPVFQQAAASSPSMYGVRSKLKVMLS